MTYNNDVHPRTISTTVDWTWSSGDEEPMGVWIQPPDYELPNAAHQNATWMGKGFNEVDYEATWPLDAGIAAGNASGPGGEDRFWNEYGSVSACCLANAYEGFRRYDVPEITVWDAFQYTSYPCFEGTGDLGNPISYGPEEYYSNAIGAYRMVMGGARITGQWQNYARGGTTEGIWYFKLDPSVLGSAGVTWDFTDTPGWPVGGPGWPPPTGTGLGLSGAVSTEQIAQWAANAGFRGSSLAIAVAVALAESSGVVDATHLNEDGSVDYGLWQINSVHTASGFDPSLAFAPSYNAYWAWRISSGGDDWTPWTTYNSGAYLQYLGLAGTISGNLVGGDVPSGSPTPLAQPALARSLEFESNVGRIVGVKLSGYLNIIGGQTAFVGGIPLDPTADPIVAQIRPIGPSQYWTTEINVGVWKYRVNFSWLTRSQMAALPVVFSGTLPTGEKGTYKYFGDYYVENAPGLGADPSVDLSPYVNTTDNSVAFLVTTQNQIDAAIPTWSPEVEDGPFGAPLITTQEYYVLPQMAVTWTIRPPRHRWIPSVSQANGEPKRVIYEHVKSVPTDFWG